MPVLDILNRDAGINIGPICEIAPQFIQDMHENTDLFNEVTLLGPRRPDEGKSYVPPKVITRESADKFISQFKTYLTEFPLNARPVLHKMVGAELKTLTNRIGMVLKIRKFKHSIME